MVPILERLRGKKIQTDSEILANRALRQATVESRIGELAKNLNTDEKIIFSTVYRFSQRVPVFDDYNLADNFGHNIKSSLNSLLSALVREKAELTPDLLWTVPGIDPSYKQRQEVKMPFEVVEGIKAETEEVIFDRAKSQALPASVA